MEESAWPEHACKEGILRILRIQNPNYTATFRKCSLCTEGKEKIPRTRRWGGAYNPQWLCLARIESKLILLHPDLQASRHWKRFLIASLAWAREETYNWVQSVYWWHHIPRQQMTTSSGLMQMSNKWSRGRTPPKAHCKERRTTVTCGYKISHTQLLEGYNNWWHLKQPRDQGGSEWITTPISSPLSDYQ